MNLYAGCTEEWGLHFFSEQIVKNLFRKSNPATFPQAVAVESAPLGPEAVEAEPAITQALQCATNEPVEHVARQYSGLIDLIVLEQHALLDLTCANEELRGAQAIAATSGISVGQSLQKRLKGLRDLRVRLILERREVQATQREDAKRAGPAIRAALAERERLLKTIAALSHSIASFETTRDEFVTNLRHAGLSREEIAAMDLKPTLGDLERWKNELSQAQARDAKLAQMLGRGAPAFLAEVSQ